MPTYLKRCRSGEHEPVWDELVRHAEEVFEEPLLSDAWAVACETMRRVRHNIELLVLRLHQLSYQFGSIPDAPNYWKDSPVFVPPSQNTALAIAQLESVVGKLPLSIRAWYQIVGQVNLVGLHADWPEIEEMDPLYVDPLCASVSGCTTSKYIYSACKDWEIDVKEFGAAEVGEFEIEMASDFGHKASMSGGAPYSFEPQHRAVDVLLLHKWHETTFVNYLRICFRWGGFPGVERCNDNVYKQNFLQHLPFLTQDFLPI